MRDSETVATFLRERLGALTPEIAVVLGSGLGVIANTLEESTSVATEEIPGFPVSTVAGHAGRVHLGRWGGRVVLLFQGRVHLYEGYPIQTVTLGVRTAAELGARYLVLTNAAGSCDRAIRPGSLMRASDLLDLFFRRLRGNSKKPFIGRGRTLDPELGAMIDEAARREKITLSHGVLCGSSGPSYESAAEIRLQRAIGAHAACMSTVPESYAAVDSGLRVAAISLITNYGTGITQERLDHAEVVEWAERAGKDLGRLLRRLAGSLPESSS